MVRIKKQKVSFRRKKNQVKRPAKGPSFKLILKFALAVIILAAIGIGLERLKYMFADSDYFRIRRIEAKFLNQEGSPRSVSLDDISDGNVIGANIFLVDLNILKGKIETSHPEFKDVSVRRVLPNKLIVQAKKRKAFMQLRSDRYYLVDDEGVFLPDIRNFPEENIPIVSGISVNIAKIKNSKFSRPREQKIDKAIFLIKSILSDNTLSKYKVKMVDLADERNISFFLDTNNVEIKIGDNEFNKRLNGLKTVLEQLGTDINKVKYIDLRFEDPIVGPR